MTWGLWSPASTMGMTRPPWPLAVLVPAAASIPVGCSAGLTRAAHGSEQPRSGFQRSEDATTSFWVFIKPILVHGCCHFKPISFQ